MDKSGLFIEEELTERDDSSPDTFEDWDTARQEDNKENNKYPIFLYYPKNCVYKQDNHNYGNVWLVGDRKMIEKLGV